MTTSPSLPSNLSKLLQQAAEEGQFEMIVLSDIDGLPFANSGAIDKKNVSCSEEILAALSSLISVFKQRVEKEIANAETDEISVVMNDKSRLVCRYFHVDTAEFILSFLVQPNQSYRRLTNSTISLVKKFYAAGKYKPPMYSA
ncbi:MAG: hypothetical protein JXB26_09535 [Candidatus Aminicenantes bacterium]|nr:hypothetical protein [Candidatus Aminicenantes bacterium]